MDVENKTGAEIALYYLKTFSQVAREPFLILDQTLKVVGANEAFYKTFQVEKTETENRLVYELGNGQWNILELKNMLEDVLPKASAFSDFEVSHEFPKIGLKIMVLNAQQLDSTKHIILAIEDVTLKRAIEAKMVNYTKDLEKGIAEKTEDLNARIDELSKLNDIMVGRELKMIELKEEIAHLKKEKNG
jgi:hypothetical protein